MDYTGVLKRKPLRVDKSQVKKWSGAQRLVSRPERLNQSRLDLMFCSLKDFLFFTPPQRGLICLALKITLFFLNFAS